jgi:hypothetical protein
MGNLYDELIDAKEVDEGHLADEAFSRWREEWSDKLDELCVETHNCFVKTKENSYYKDREEEFILHWLFNMQRITNCKVSVDQYGCISVRKNQPIIEKIIKVRT